MMHKRESRCGEIALAALDRATARWERDCFNADERTRFLRTAAQDGHVPAMYELALQCGNPLEATYWLSGYPITRVCRHVV